MITHRGQPVECPRCGYYMDCHTAGPDSAPPRPGDASICLNCGELLEYDANLKLIEMSDALQEQLQKQGDFSTLMKNQLYIAKRGPIRDYRTKPKKNPQL